MNLISRYFISILLLILAWKFASTLLTAAVLPSPEAALAEFVSAVKNKTYQMHFLRSAYRVCAAMAFAWIIAFPLGIIIGYHRLANRYLSPFIFLTYPIPKIVFLPIFLILFGLGDLTKIFMVALIVGYQILVATRDGVLAIDKKYIDSFRAMGRNSIQAVRHVTIPAALPHAFTALRIGTGASIAVLFFVESFATNQGMGYFIMESWSRIDYERMFTGIIGMSLLGVLIYELINYLERTVCAWKYIETGRNRTRLAGFPIKGFVIFGKMIKFSHTIFALPFALSAAILAHREAPVTSMLLFWILTSMIGARSAAMGFNRIVDARFDALNPRTSNRAIPAKEISSRSAIIFVVFFSIVFIFSTAMINHLCFILSIPVLFILFSYSYTKRFTFLSHLYLGFSISIAPIMAWIAVTGSFDPKPLVISGSLLFYIAGFDVMYACQDIDFDRNAGLQSIPAKLGLVAALNISTALHIVAFVFIFLVQIVFGLGIFYAGALILIGILLIVEHRLVKPHNLSLIDISFFHVNSAISIVLFLGVLGDELIRKFG